jgi:acyl-coenzyme A thioesterase PaaI-like protein
MVAVEIIMPLCNFYCGNENPRCLFARVVFLLLESYNTRLLLSVHIYLCWRHNWWLYAEVVHQIGTLHMELNDTTDYQRCFVCGQRNPYGLHLVFQLDQNTVVADFQPREEHQGFPGVIHGGIVAAVLDEALGRTSLLGNIQEWTMTGRLEMRYRRYVPYGPLLRVRASLDMERRRLFQASGVLTLADDESVVLAEAHGTFLSLPPNMVDTLMKDYPELQNFFEQNKPQGI